MIRSFVRWCRGDVRPWKSSAQAWRAAPADHLSKWSEPCAPRGRYRFKNPAIAALAAAAVGLSMGPTTVTFTSSGTLNLPSTLSGGAVTFTVVGAPGGGASGVDGGAPASITFTVPASPSEEFDIVVASGQSGKHSGGTGGTGAGDGGGSTAVTRHSTGVVEGEAAGGGGAGGPGTTGTAGEGGNGGEPNGSDGGASLSGSNGKGAGFGADGTGGSGTFEANNGSNGSSGTGGNGGAPGSTAGGGGGGGGGTKGGGGGEGDLTATIFGGTVYYGGGGGGGGQSSVASDATSVTYGTGSAAVVIATYNVVVAPPAPTLVSPTNGSTLDGQHAGVTLSGTYHQNVGSGTLQKVLARVNTGSGYQYWTGSTLSGTPTWIVPTTGAGVAEGGKFTVAVPSGKLTDPSTVSWNLACQEASKGLQGSFAATDFVFSSLVIPTVTITTPSSVVESTTPGVAWTDTITGGSQLSYEGVVYSQDQVDSDGFSPGGTTPLYDTGVVSGTATSFSIPSGAGLMNGGTYWVFVQITATGPVSSAWTGAQFSIELDAPQAPTVSAVPSTDPTTGNPGNLVTVVGNDNYLSFDGSSFENSTGGYSASNGTLSQTTSWAQDGGSALKALSSAAGAVNVWAAVRMPVVAGQVVGLMVTARAAGSARAISLIARWYDSTNTHLSDTTVATANDSSSGVALAGSAVAPASGFVDIEVSWTATGASEEHDFDEAGLFANGLPAAWSVGGMLGNVTAEVQYSDDGITWADLRYGSVLELANQQGAILDQEAPFNVARQYQARINALSGGQQESSDWSTPASSTCPSQRWWISIPDYLSGLADGVLWAISPWRMTPAGTTSTTGGAASLSGGLTASIEEDQIEQQGTFQAAGVATAQIVRGVRMAPSLPALTLFFDNDADFQTFDTIVGQQRTVLIRSDMNGRCYYGAIGGQYQPVTIRAADRRTNPQRQVTITLSPTTAP